VPGKSIRIYLADGTPLGIRHAEVVNWTGQAIVVPRHRLSELRDWEQSQRPGVYFLFGEDPATLEDLAYIGESENVFDRLRQHSTAKEFWREAVFFTSKDENLTKSHVKFLEARLIEQAIKAQRWALENGNVPALASLPRADRDAMDEFLGPLRLLLRALGFTILDPIKSPSTVVQTSAESASLDDHGPQPVVLSLRVPKYRVNAMGGLYR